MSNLLEANHYIDGEARAASDGKRYEIFNPARPDELVGTAALGTHDDVEAAVAGAHRAFGPWSRLSYGERAEMLIKIGKALAADPDEMEQRAQQFTREHGKVLFETRLEITRLGIRFQQVAGYAEQLAKDEEISGPPFDTIVTRQPRGVALLIVPWNWPLSIMASKLPQALLAGNTVVVKPSESATLVPTKTLHMIAALLPPGVLNIVTGDATKIGDALVGHPKVRMVNFTGSVRIGRHVMRVAAENITPVTLELGGNDAGVVMPDAAMDDEAFQRMWKAVFMTSGQVCMALKRLYVHRSRFDDVVDGMRAACDAAIIGDGLLEETSMGPLHSAKQLATVSGMVEEARQAGVTIEERGQVPDPELFHGGGYFHRPTLLIDPDPNLSIVTEEQFGPALPILPFDDADDVVELVNDSPYGLCSSIWTKDLERATALSRRIEAGFTYFNSHGAMAMDGRSPFGGFKQSGIGRNYGFEGVTQFQGYHSISSAAGSLV